MPLLVTIKVWFRVLDTCALEKLTWNNLTGQKTLTTQAINFKGKSHTCTAFVSSPRGITLDEFGLLPMKPITVRVFSDAEKYLILHQVKKRDERPT